MTEKTQISFTRLQAVSRDIVYLGTEPDDQELGTPFTAICQYYEGAWSYETFDFPLSSLTLYQAPGSPHRVLYVLSETGVAVNFHTKEQEIILPPRSPLRKDHRLGYVLKIRQIGNRLYVCGHGGQVFRRDGDGTWSVLDEAFLNGPDAIMDPKSELSLLSSLMSLPENQTDENYEKEAELREQNASTTLWDVDGLSESSIYFASEKNTVYWFDGDRITAVPSDAEDGVLAILAESEDRIWACGRNGLLMVGNRTTGFQQLHVLGAIDGWPNFNGMALFQDRLYLSSYADPRGLFVFDGRHLEQVRSGLVPDIEDVSAVSAVGDDVLWVMGRKDLLRFDGNTWERIDFPRNDQVAP